MKLDINEVLSYDEKIELLEELLDEAREEDILSALKKILSNSERENIAEELCEKEHV